ncbi:N-acetyltransferase [Effusibacillus dendaii]|uniref:Acetyltransferase n=1 Tax=Effusibacillus dendaii TaxID=2743772 RepID=A0A7I8DF30_9BACL|nr:N-acetyltransferase [Effusibacillus dendaii]BCJ87902.1 acetyltransferase [Effusibacillus dendaii]
MQFRKAVMADTEAIYELIQSHADQGLLLPRPRISLYENLQSLTVVEEEGRIVGVGGLHILWQDLSEIRSLAIAHDKKGMGLGRELVSILVKESQQLGIPRILSLTYQVEFFQKCGFQIVQKETLPQKVWKDCVNCSKFLTCDEIAMLLTVPVTRPLPVKPDETTPIPLKVL